MGRLIFSLLVIFLAGSCVTQPEVPAVAPLGQASDDYLCKAGVNYRLCVNCITRPIYGLDGQVKRWVRVCN